MNRFSYSGFCNLAKHWCQQFTWINILTVKQLCIPGLNPIRSFKYIIRLVSIVSCLDLASISPVRAACNTPFLYVDVVGIGIKHSKTKCTLFLFSLSLSAVWVRLEYVLQKFVELALTKLSLWENFDYTNSQTTHLAFWFFPS